MFHRKHFVMKGLTILWLTHLINCEGCFCHCGYLMDHPRVSLSGSAMFTEAFFPFGLSTKLFLFKRVYIISKKGKGMRHRTALEIRTFLGNHLFYRVWMRDSLEIWYRFRLTQEFPFITLFFGHLAIFSVPCTSSIEKATAWLPFELNCLRKLKTPYEIS